MASLNSSKDGTCGGRCSDDKQVEAKIEPSRESNATLILLQQLGRWPPVTNLRSFLNTVKSSNISKNV